MEKVIIVRYGEIGIKSHWIRREFEKKLADNISRALLENKIEIEKIKQQGARIYIWCHPFKKALKVLKNVFGIVSYSPAEIIKSDIDEMKKWALKAYKKSGKRKFRISTRRRDKGFPLSSMKTSAEIGAYIVEKGKGKVDLTNYDINISFEVNKKRTYAFSEYYKGWGGLPIGVQGKVLCVVSDKKEGWINTFLMARRGSYVIIVDTDSSKRVAKKFEKKYYFTDEECTYYNISKSKNTIDRIIDVAMLENAKAIVVPNKYLGKFESKTKLLVFYPSMGFSTKRLNELWKRINLD